MSTSNRFYSPAYRAPRQLRTIYALALFAIGIVGVTYAGIDQLQIICDNCAIGPADVEPVCGDRKICEAGEICISVARDWDSNGTVDLVENFCILNPRAL